MHIPSENTFALFQSIFYSSPVFRRPNISGDKYKFEISLLFFIILSKEVMNCAFSSKIRDLKFSSKVT